MLLNLSLVTDALISLIDKYIRASPGWPIGVTLNVSAEPRDKLTGESTIGMYLYHITEDAHFKNLPPPSADLPPIRYTPMGLNLYYQLSARSSTQGDPGIQREQQLLGLAIKALRDYPVVDDSTMIANTKIFTGDLDRTDNRFRISLLPITHNEALNFSTSGEHRLRLAVYYQVSVALLEPEKPTLRAGRVLKYGVFTFTRGAPRLDGSRSTVTFKLPGETATSVVEAQPAEVYVRNTVLNTGGEIIFFGSDLTGDTTTLLIKNKRSTEPIEVGTEWGVTATDDRVFAVVYPTAGSVMIVPGIYSAAAKVVTHQMDPDNKMRTFIKTSNEMPFIVTPRIDTPIAQPVARVFTVTGGVFKHPDIESIEVFVGSNLLKAGSASNPGEFEVSATELKFQFPNIGIITGEIVPFRVIINGAESAPNWVTAP
jgi:hypothetical protein